MNLLFMESRRKADPRLEANICIPYDFIFWYLDHLKTWRKKKKKEQDVSSLPEYLIIKNPETVYIILGE